MGHVRARSRPSAGALAVLGLAVIFFVLPLVATVQFSLQHGSQAITLAPYQEIVSDPLFWGSLQFSVTMALLTIVLGMLVVVPAAYWVRLRLPQAHGVVEFICLLPFVVPGVVLAIGLARAYGSGNAGPLSNFQVLLVGAYTVLSLPFLFRAVDSGLRAIDVRTLTEAALSLGAGWPAVLWRVVLPNIRAGLLAGAFLVFAIVLGEYTIASLLGFSTLGVYTELEGAAHAHAAAALVVLSFALVWSCIGLMQIVSGGGTRMLEGGGAR